MNAIHEHGRSRLDVEVCGVLVGNAYRDANGPYLHVSRTICGNHAGSQIAQVTFTAETWQHIHTVLDRDCPDRRMLGWYHTHPGFGIFLSEADMFIHRNFFMAPEQLALVYDPRSGAEGVFAWRQGEAVQGPYLIEEDAGDVAKGPIDIRVAVAAADSNGIVQRVDRLDGRHKRIHGAIWAALLLAVVCSLCLWWFLLRSRSKRSDPQAGAATAVKGHAIGEHGSLRSYQHVDSQISPIEAQSVGD